MLSFMYVRAISLVEHRDLVLSASVLLYNASYDCRTCGFDIHPETVWSRNLEAEVSHRDSAICVLSRNAPCGGNRCREWAGANPMCLSGNLRPGPAFLGYWYLLGLADEGTSVVCRQRCSSAALVSGRGEHH